MPTLRERFASWLAKAEDPALDDECEDDRDLPTSEHPTASEGPPPALDPEKAALKAEVDRLKAAEKARFDDQVQRDAEAFVAGLKDNLVPALATGFADLYVQAALDDHADGGQRLDMVKALADALPRHGLTAAQTVNADVEVVTPPPPSDPYQAAYDATTKAMTERSKL